MTVAPAVVNASVCTPTTIPDNPEPSPRNDVAVNAPDDELNVRLDPVFGGRLPVAAVTNVGKQVVSDDSSATVTLVAVDAVPTIVPPVTIIPALAVIIPTESTFITSS